MAHLRPLFANPVTYAIKNDSNCTARKFSTLDNIICEPGYQMNTRSHDTDYNASMNSYT